MPESKTNKQQEKTNELLSEELQTRTESLKLLRDKYDLEEDLIGLLRDENKLEKSQRESLGTVVDKTKEILENRKDIYNESFQTVDLEKLHRQLIAEGLSDRAQIITKLKAEQEIQKQTNRIVNAQAGAYEKIGGSIDSLISSIPGVGGMLSQLLGTDNLGKDMSSAFRTSMAETQKEGGGFGLAAGAEFTGSFFSNLFRKGGKERSFFRTFGGVAALGVGAAFALAIRGGLESLTISERLKKFFSGGAFDGIKDAFGRLDRTTIANILGLRALKFRFGIDTSDSAKILQAQTAISGLTDKQARDTQLSIARFARLRNVLPADVLGDIASNTEMFAKFAKDGGVNLGIAAVQAKELGLSLSTIDSISSSILSFQSSIESELEASLLIGRQLNLNRARELALAGDQAGLLQEIVKQVGSEEELNRMNVIQRKKLAEALGITVQELGKLADRQVELGSSDIQKNTLALKELNKVLLATAGIGAGKVLQRSASGIASTAVDVGLLGRQSAATGRGLTLMAGLTRLGQAGVVIGVLTGLVSVVKTIKESMNRNSQEANELRRKSQNDFQPFLNYGGAISNK